jgi:hypothetical protein
MRRARRGNEQLVAARTGTGRLFRNLGWALTLALGLGGLLGGLLGGSLFRLPTLANSLSIPATLLAAALATTLRLPPRLTGTPMPPPIRRPLTCRTAIPRLRPPGLKKPFAAFHQAAAPPRPPAVALPRTRSSIVMELTQGSDNSRRSSPGEEPLLLSRTPCIRCLILRLPLPQSNDSRPWPPLLRRSAAADQCGATVPLPVKWFNSRPPLTTVHLPSAYP